MTWFKVDDSFHSHPKVLATEPAALGLWVIAGAWSSANLTDGFVPDYALPRLLPGSETLAKKLVAVGLWKRSKGGYQFHDWHDYNPTSIDVQAEREAARERMRKLRAARRSGEQRPNSSRAEGHGQVTEPRNGATKRPSAKHGSNGRNAPSTSNEEMCSGEQPANVRENFGVRSQPRPDPSSTTHRPSGPLGRNATARDEPPPSDGPPTRVELLLTSYREDSPRGVPAKQAEKLAAEIHQLVADGFTDAEIAYGLRQLRPRRLGPAMLATLVDELANETRAPNQPGNVVALRPDRSPPHRRSTTDERVAAGLALAAKYDALEAQGGTP